MQDTQNVQDTQDNEQCPAALLDNAVNAKNHLLTIANQGLGPSDPRQVNSSFWQDKAKKWQVSEGDARGRLCANCEHYLSTTFIDECIKSGPAIDIKASDLPLLPKWVDIESRPTAFCTLFEITCSPIRTCDAQEMGGPMDDLKVKALELAALAAEYDTEELTAYIQKMYSKDNVPNWASKKSAKVQEVAIRVFNETMKGGASEEKSRIASLAAMQNAEAAEKKSLKKSHDYIADIIKSRHKG
jgi:hypothetical protein